MFDRITRSLIAIAVAMMALPANAVLVQSPFNGSWDEFHTWNPGQTGDPTLSTTPGGGPEMAVAGTITYDDETGIVSAITINQVGENTRNWDFNPQADPLSPDFDPTLPVEPEYDTVTLSGFSWVSDGTDLRLESGTFQCNGANNAACGPGAQFGGNYIGRGGPLENFGPPFALTDFIGADYQLAYGDILNGPGFIGLVYEDGQSGENRAIIQALTGWDGFVSLGSTAKFNLTLIPVPAAAWLFGSALGLLGWLRARKHSA